MCLSFLHARRVFLRIVVTILVAGFGWALLRTFAFVRAASAAHDLVAIASSAFVATVVIFAFACTGAAFTFAWAGAAFTLVVLLAERSTGPVSSPTPASNERQCFLSCAISCRWYRD